MDSDKSSVPPVNREQIAKAREKLRELKEKANLNQPGALEALMDSVASTLAASGLSGTITGAPSLKEVLEKMNGANPAPAGCIEAAAQLAYLIEASWYDDEAPLQEQIKANALAAELCDGLTPLLDKYDRG